MPQSSERKPDGNDAGNHDDQDTSAFKREGPTPSNADTGGSVDEMNRNAEDALLRNVRPDEQVD